MIDSRFAALLYSAALLSSLAVGCSTDASEDAANDGDTIHFTPLEQRSHTVESVDSPAPPTSFDKQPGYREIVEGVRNNALALFQRDGIDERIGRIERVFMATGRYLELVDVYQKVVDELGYRNPAASRLGWAYIRLGQREQARRFVETLEERRPDEPVVFFLKGALSLERAPDEREAAARTVRAWRRTLELDPDFEGFGGLAADSLRRQTERLQNRLDKPVDAILADASRSETDDAAARTRDSTDGERQLPNSRRRADAPDQPSGASTNGERELPSSRREAESSDRTARDSSDGERELPSSRREAESSDRTARNSSDGERELPSSRSVADAGPPDGSQPGPDASAGGPPVEVRLTRAELAASRGNWEEADSLYGSILEDHPDELEARIGELKAAWHLNGDADAARSTLRDLADAKALTARQAYELATFAESTLDDRKLASRLFDRVRDLDPDFADRMGVPGD